MGTDDLEAHNNALEAKYRRAEKRETRAEHWYTEDADIVLVGYGIVGRILKAVVADAREMGIKVGLLRPITLYPFPTADFQRLARHAQSFVVVEMSNGQLHRRCSPRLERLTSSRIPQSDGWQCAIARRGP